MSRAPLALLLLLIAGCASQPKLDVIPHQAASEPPPPPLFRWEARFKLDDARPNGVVVAWVPLPRSTEAQGVRSLLYQLGPEGKLSEERTKDGDRLLRVRAPRAVLRTLRITARFEQRAVPPRDLPAELAGLDRSDPAAWVRAAQEAGAEARLVHGVGVTPSGAETTRWPELKRDDDWVAVDLEQGRLHQRDGHLRLATVRPRATLDGEPVPIRTRHTLARTN